jgi:hypothetical protein
MIMSADEGDFVIDPGELELWKTRLADLPELRWAKVARVRRAIVTDRYESDLVLDVTVDGLQSEIGILCREGDLDSPA